MTLISHEVPKSLFSHHGLISDYPYVLGHLLKLDSEYEKFYRRMMKTSSFSILDNSCFELNGNSISNSELSSLIGEYKPSHYILPDVLHNKEATLQRSTQFLNTYRKLDKEATPIGVLQGKTFEELGDCFHWYRGRGITYIAIPFDPLPDSHYGVSRYLVFRELFYSIKSQSVDIHFLGCDNPSELLLYSGEEVDYITSIDTSSPIITGWNGIRYGEYGYNGPKPKEKLAENLDISLSLNQIEDIIYNIKKFRTYLLRQKCCTR